MGKDYEAEDTKFETWRDQQEIRIIVTAEVNGITVQELEFGSIVGVEEELRKIELSIDEELGKEYQRHLEYEEESVNGSQV